MRDWVLTTQENSEQSTKTKQLGPKNDRRNRNKNTNLRTLRKVALPSLRREIDPLVSEDHVLHLVSHPKK